MVTACGHLTLPLVFRVVATVMEVVDGVCEIVTMVIHDGFKCLLMCFWMVVMWLLGCQQGCCHVVGMVISVGLLPWRL